MTIDDLMDELGRNAVALSLHDDRLRYDAPKGALSPELREAISANRAAIVARLSEAATKMEPVRKRCGPCDPLNWVDDSPEDGRIRTTCSKCGRFIGYRPEHVA